jgi:predicted porin
MRKEPGYRIKTDMLSVEDRPHTGGTTYTFALMERVRGPAFVAGLFTLALAVAPTAHAQQANPAAQAPPPVSANTSVQAAGRDNANPFAALAYAPDMPTKAPLQVKVAPAVDSGCASYEQFRDTDCSLTWHGITIYGTYDIGAGWVSHGTSPNGVNYEGESLVNRNGNSSRFLIAPNNLSQTGLGIKGKEEILNGWFGVFNASTGFNPQSGQLANQAAANTINNGLPRSSYTNVGDGSRAGQVFNDELYAGVSSPAYGTLTFGRQRALGTDAMLTYDPAGGAYSFSFIGYNGLMAGGGDTQDTRLDDTIKYRVTFGPVHFGALYKFADGSGGCFSATAGWTASTCTAEAPHNSAYGLDFGGEFGNFSGDVVYQHVNQAISVVNPLLGPTSLTQPYQSTTNSINTNPITGANLIDPTNTEYGIVTDNNAIMFAGKYAWNQFKFYGGYEYVREVNPANPLGIGATAQGGYILSGVEDNNLDSPKIVQVFWTGAKYAFNSQAEVTLSYYREIQNDFRVPSTCSAAADIVASCAGSLNEVSLFGDYHFTKRFDVYAGIAYSDVTGGLAVAIPHGPGVPYYYNNNLAPTVGARYTF